MRAHKATQGEPDFSKLEPMPKTTSGAIDDDGVGGDHPHPVFEGGNKYSAAGVPQMGQPQSSLPNIDAAKSDPSPGDPLAKLFRTIAMEEIDTSDCWMEPRPIAPGPAVTVASAPVGLAASSIVPTSQANLSGAGVIGTIANLSIFPPNPSLSDSNEQRLEFYRKVSEVSQTLQGPSTIEYEMELVANMFLGVI